MKMKDLPQGKAAYESSLKAAAEKYPELKGTHVLPADIATYVVPGCVGQTHIAVAKLTGRTPGSLDWLAACLYATPKGASDNMIKLITGGSRNNVWRDCANGLKAKLKGFNLKN